MPESRDERTYPFLTVDQAVSEFMATMQEHFGSTATERRGPSTETREEAEARRFDFAETVLSLASPIRGCVPIIAVGATGCAGISPTCTQCATAGASCRRAGDLPVQ
jgi:hypothetical protein